VITAPGLRDAASGPPAASGLIVYPFASSDRRFKLGRSTTLCEIVIRDSRVSKQHAVVAPDGERTWVWDLNSSNGTFIDERCLAPGEAGRADVSLGHTFRLGDVGIVLLGAAGLRDLAQK
jgi:pSer/pThr/pTyr-binding forkhead associated (FHA) protein